MDKQELFKNVVYELSNQTSSKTYKELRGLYAKLAFNGQDRSGYAVDSTYRLVNDNISEYIKELVRQITDNISNYEIILDDNELDDLFYDIERSSCGLIEGLMRERKRYLDICKLKDSRLDYKTLMIQNCTNKLTTEKKNLSIRISYILEKHKRVGFGLNVTNNCGQINLAFDDAQINTKKSLDD